MAKTGGKRDESGAQKRAIAKTDKVLNKLNKQPGMSANEKLLRAIKETK